MPRPGTSVEVHLDLLDSDATGPLFVVLEGGGRVLGEAVWQIQPKGDDAQSIELAIPDDARSRLWLRVVGPRLGSHVLPVWLADGAEPFSIHRALRPECRDAIERIAVQVALARACSDFEPELDTLCRSTRRIPVASERARLRSLATSTRGWIALGLLALALVGTFVGGVWFLWRGWTDADSGGGWVEAVIGTIFLGGLGAAAALADNAALAAFAVSGLLVLIFALGREFSREPNSFALGWSASVVCLSVVVGFGWYFWGLHSPEMFQIFWSASLACVAFTGLGSFLAARVLLAQSQRLVGWALMWIPAALVFCATWLLTSA